jgi:hypothetical protein
MKASIKMPLKTQIIVAFSPSKTYTPVAKPIAIQQLKQRSEPKRTTRKASSSFQGSS